MGGRGRGAASSKTFSREQLVNLGVGANEVLPGPVLQPPPVYPLLDRRPVPLAYNVDMDYMLILRQDFIDHMQLSPAYLKMPENRNENSNEQQIDKLIAQLPSAREKFDWSLFPSELRPKSIAKRLLKPIAQVKEVDVNKTLDKLDSIEKKSEQDLKVKTDLEKEDEDKINSDDDIAEEVDDEMDDGTDYVNNYFDNGEGYDEDDDNMDDGPIY